jgi:hypothetical protein
LKRDPQLPGSPPNQLCITRRVGGGELQQPLRLRRERRQLLGEALLDTGRYRHHTRQAEAAGQLRLGYSSQQFQKGQRVSTGFPHDLVPYSFVKRPAERRFKEKAGFGGWQPSQEQVRYSGQLLPDRAGTEHEPDRVGRQTPGGEPERVSRCLVQPLLVVDHAQQRAFRGSFGQQAKDREPNQEPIGG